MPRLPALLLVCTPIFSTDFSVKTVDRLDRPLAGVVIEFECDGYWLRFESNQDGIAEGMRPCATPVLTFISKEGFQGYATGLRSKYVLDRIADAQELSRIATLDKGAQLEEAKALFASPSLKPELSDAFFYTEARWRPMLLKLAADQSYARSMLGLIAVPEDLHFLVALPDLPSSDGFWEVGRYYVAASLIYPDDEAEWRFLQVCATGEERWAKYGAIQTLKLTASPRSQKILEEARLRNKDSFGFTVIDEALDYVKSKPAPLADENLEPLVRRVAAAIHAGSWEKIGAPGFNEAQNKALVNLDLPACGSNYTATFHRVDGKWALRAVRDRSAGSNVDCNLVH